MAALATCTAPNCYSSSTLTHMSIPKFWSISLEPVPRSTCNAPPPPPALSGKADNGSSLCLCAWAQSAVLPPMSHQPAQNPSCPAFYMSRAGTQQFFWLAHHHHDILAICPHFEEWMTNVPECSHIIQAPSDWISLNQPTNWPTEWPTHRGEV